jgi:hypothetical protein
MLDARRRSSHSNPTAHSKLLLANWYADTAFKSWLRATSTCRFPCWANIIPGKTSWAEAIHILEPVLELHFAENVAIAASAHANISLGNMN